MLAHWCVQSDFRVAGCRAWHPGSSVGLLVDGAGSSRGWLLNLVFQSCDSRAAVSPKVSQS